VRLDYILSANPRTNQHLVDELHSFPFYLYWQDKGEWELGCGLPINLRYQSLFYHLASHYLRPKLYYYIWLVKIAVRVFPSI